MKSSFLKTIEVFWWAFISLLVCPGQAQTGSWDRLTINGYKLRYYRNTAIENPNGEANYSQAVVVVHGSSRNADDYYNNMATAAQIHGRLNNTLLMAPLFQELDDQPAADELYWSGGWRQGFKAVNGNRPSSFSVMDFLLEQISQNFPTISTVTVAGHSAGGQYVQRYAALNTFDQSSPITIRYVVANPSSYMFIRKSWDYKYGTGTLPSSLAYTNLKHRTIKSQLLARQVFVLLGSDDNDPNANLLDKSPEAMKQGQHRLKRGQSYYSHIVRKAAKANTMVNHFLSIVPGVGHSNSGVFQSVEGRQVIFV